MAIPVAVPLHTSIKFAGFASSIMTKSISALYKMGKDINGYIDNHIEEMKSSNILSVSRVGAVLEAAKFGFGLGYLSSVTILCVGQLLLGNPLQAMIVVAGSATFSNPTAMTCASIGAVYFGWNALSENEKSDILDKLSSGLSIGIEFIKAIIEFFNNKLKDLNDSAILKQIKTDIYDAAKLFNKKLSDVTRSTKDMALEMTQTFIKHVSAFQLPSLDRNGDGKIDLNDLFPLKQKKVPEGKESISILGQKKTKKMSNIKSQPLPETQDIQKNSISGSGNQQSRKRKSDSSNLVK